MNKRFFYGWVVAVAAGLGIACGVSVFIPATIGLLVGPLGRDLGWSPPAIYFALMMPAIATVVMAPFVGALIDKWGAKRMIAFAFVAEAAVVGSFYFLGPDIYGFYIRYALFAILGTATTAVSFTVLVSKWFDRKRGLALGIALAGTGFGGASWSLLAQALLDHYGWRTSFLFMSTLIMLVLAVLMLVLRETPESMGQNVDGVSASSGGANAQRSKGMTLKEACLTKQYWLMIFTFLIVVSAVYSVMLHLVPMLKQRGVSPQAAAGIQASLWIALVFGRIGTGWLMDRIFAPYVAIGCLLPSILGMALLASGATGSVAVFSAMMVGVAAGSEIDVVAYLCGRYFGLKHYSAIYGTLFAACALGTAIGPALAANLLPLLGGYSGVLWFEIGLIVVGIVFFLRFPRFEPPSVAYEVAQAAR